MVDAALLDSHSQLFAIMAEDDICRKLGDAVIPWHHLPGGEDGRLPVGGGAVVLTAALEFDEGGEGGVHTISS